VPVASPACGDPDGTLFAYSQSGGRIGLPDEWHSFDDATARAFGDMIPIWVYHFDPAASATFDVRVQCVDDPCVAGTVDRLIIDQDAPFGIFDDNTGADDTVAIGCGFMGDPGGADRVYLFRPRTTTTYTFDTCNFFVNPDTMIAIRQGDCVTGAEIACNDVSTVTCPATPTLFLSEMISVPLTAGQDYYLIVDGYLGEEGTFFLTVTSP